MRGPLLAVLLAAAGAACAPAPESPRPPSFVLVLADDLGWADVGFQGSTFHRTPALDALASDGLVFSQAYAAAPVCSPSRAALLTGQAPARLHLTDALGPRSPTEPSDTDDEGRLAGTDLSEPRVLERLPPELPTLATRLAERGYRTAWIGKWHLGGRPGEHGFEHVLGDSTAGAARTYFSPYGLATLADGPPGEYLTDRLTEEAVRFLAEHAAEHASKPFLLVLSHYAPHLPLEAPPDLVAAYQARFDLAAPQHNPFYAAMIERLDASVGRLRAELERLGRTRDTWLVFTSDNGGLEERRLERQRKVVGREASRETYHITSNAPLRDGKGRCYEGGLRVPLVLWGGPLARRGTCAVPVIGMDLAPTLLALAGAAPLAPCDGLDLSPLLAGDELPHRELPRRELGFHFPHGYSQSALRAGDEKLVLSWRQDRSELFDLASDPGERHDLAAERPERAAELRAELLRWLGDVGAALPHPAPR
jgi:arylsulfatase A